MLFIIVIYKDMWLKEGLSVLYIYIPISTVKNKALGSTSCLTGQLPSILVLHLPWPEILISTQPATTTAFYITHSDTAMTTTVLSHNQTKQQQKNSTP